MTARGMCAGCAETGEAKAVSWHITWCKAYAAAFAKDPAGTLDPAAYYTWWNASVRPGLKAADLDRRVGATLEQRAAGEARFAGPGDWLDDDGAADDWAAREHDEDVGTAVRGTQVAPGGGADREGAP